jgi:hypothetical protein
MMDQDTRINDFIAGNAAPTLVVRQDDRVIALASLPLLGLASCYWCYGGDR